MKKGCKEDSTMLPVIAERYADMDDQTSSEEDEEEDVITLKKRIRKTQSGVVTKWLCE